MTPACANVNSHQLAQGEADVLETIEQMPSLLQVPQASILPLGAVLEHQRLDTEREQSKILS